MSTHITVQNVATAAGVSRSTVSRVFSGKADKDRISPATQKRIRAIASQLGYQAGAFIRYRATQRTGISDEKSQMAEKTEHQIGLILSTNSPDSSLAFIPGLIPTLATAGYELVIVTLPADPTAVRQQVLQLLNRGLSGLLCCPTLYAAVSEIAGGEKPVGSAQLAVDSAPVTGSPTRPPIIVLWQGAGKAMVKSVGGEEPVGSEPLAVGSREEPVPGPVTPSPEPDLTESPTALTPQETGPVLAGSPITTPPPPQITNNPINNPPRAVAPDDLCPCGSGKKFKKCHGKWGAGQTTTPLAHPELDLIFAESSSPITKITNNPIPNNSGAVAPDDPCPCGSGKKYKKCHRKWGGGQI